MFGFGNKKADKTWFEEQSEAQKSDRSVGAYFPVPEENAGILTLPSKLNTSPLGSLLS